jgi:ribosome maturation factor RimP
MAKAETAAIEARCAKIAEEMGFELVDAGVEKEPTGKYLRFYIDKPEGISLDDCEAYHKAVRSLADKVDYDFMEVSSPGIDRPLKKDRDFERNLGSEIEVKLFKPMDGATLWTGILAGLEDGNILLETPEGVKHIPRKAAALVKPVVDMEGIEEVDLSEPTESKNTESGENKDEV